MLVSPNALDELSVFLLPGKPDQRNLGRRTHHSALLRGQVWGRGGKSQVIVPKLLSNFSGAHEEPQS